MKASFAAVVVFVLAPLVAACSGGSSGSTGQIGSGEGSCASGGSETAAGAGRASSESGSEGSGEGSGANGDTSTTSESSDPDSSEGSTTSNGPRPECVAYASAYCGCLPSPASNCTKNAAEQCELGMGICAAEYGAYYRCITNSSCKWSSCESQAPGPC